MLLIPAIDLKDGHCVRLVQGDMDQSTVFSEDPAQMALQWVNKGARRLHLVDLNGAFIHGLARLGLAWNVIPHLGAGKRRPDLEPALPA